MAKIDYANLYEKNIAPFEENENQPNEFETLLNDSFLNASVGRYKFGDKIEGVVLLTTADFVFVDLGGKSTGSLPTNEFLSSGLSVPKVGERVQAFVKSNSSSEVMLTRSISRSGVDSSMLKDAFFKGIPIEAKVEKVVNGGFEASVGTNRCFVPLSQIDINVAEDHSKYCGNIFKFYITEFKGRNIILSRKQLLKEEESVKSAEVLATLAVGQTHPATITRIKEFGAFASIQGIEGLIPIGDLSWKKVKRIEDIVKVGDVVNVVISKIEHAPKLRVSFSLKNAGEDPWLAFSTRLEPGNQLQGQVTKLIPTGAFVNVTEGVDGFVPIGQITWEKRIAHPKECLAEGQEVSVYVMNVDIDNRKLGLSIKGPIPDSLQQKMKGRKNSQGLMSEEDKELLKEWDEYQSSAVLYAKKHSSENSIMASAFKTARTRNSRA